MVNIVSGFDVSAHDVLWVFAGMYIVSVWICGVVEFCAEFRNIVKVNIAIIRVITAEDWIWCRKGKYRKCYRNDTVELHCE